MSQPDIEKFLKAPLKVINVGLEGFAEELERQGVAVVQVDWRPPAGGDPKLAELLSKLGA
jgi:FdrA protein